MGNLANLTSRNDSPAANPDITLIHTFHILRYAFPRFNNAVVDSRACESNDGRGICLMVLWMVTSEGHSGPFLGPGSGEVLVDMGYRKLAVVEDLVG